MEPPEKKLKALDKPSMDPFKTIDQPMVQDLSGKEFLKLFEVSQSWNRVMSGSRMGMKKIELVFIEESPNDPSPKEVTNLLSSGRMYRNVRLDLHHKTNKNRKLLLLQTFSQSVVNLEFGVYWRNDDVKPLPDNMTFPNLMSLKLKGGLVTEIIPKFKAVTTLKSLTIDNFDMTKSGFVDWLKQQEQLKDLDLYLTRDYFFDQTSLSDASFKLNTLAWRKPEPTRLISKAARVNFDYFMLRNSGTLTSLHLNLCYPEDIELIDQMTTLKNLSFERVTTRMRHFQVMEPNKNITEFIWCGDRDIPKMFLSSLHNLEILKMGKIDKEIFTWAIQNLPKLKKLVYLKKPISPMSFEEARKHYRRMKLTDPAINRVVIAKEFDKQLIFIRFDRIF